MAELGRDYQIIVVDDASTDTTPAVLSPYIRVLPLTVMRNQQRRGYTDSLELAIREAVRRSPYPKRDAVIVMQADFTEDPDIVPAMIKRIEAGADIVATDTELEPTAPFSMRVGRKVLRWLLRKHEWGTLGDPLSGLRAYRIVVLKRAIDARANARLLTWNGPAANAELLAQTAPVARRNDVIESTIKHHRLQRSARFSFGGLWRDVLGVRSGKPAPHARPLPLDSSAVAPLPIAVEPPAAARPKHHRDEQRPRRERGPRGQGTQVRGPRRERSKNGPRPAAPPKTAVTAAPAAPAAEETEKQNKKRRRPRRRKPKHPQQETPTLAQDNPEQTDSQGAVSLETAPAPEAGAAPRKKSRRGRRGGRGRRRGPRPDQQATDNATGNGGDTPPPMAAEGD